MKKFFLLSAALVAAASMYAEPVDFDVYVIGSNVNGQSWATGAEDAKMTQTSDGVFEWDGNFLGTGFKFNDGGWSNDEHNWGSNGAEVSLTVPYDISVGGSTGNIGFDGFTGVKTPHIVFNLNEMTIVVSGEADGVYEWYLVGSFNEYHGPDGNTEGEIKFTEVGSKLYAYEGMEFTDGDTVIKMSDTGWHKQYGDNDGIIMWGTTTEIAPGVNGATLQECGQDGTMPCYLFGTYNISWNLDTLYLEFVEAGGDSVNAIEAVNGAAEYFNLQGVKVNEPANGLYIKVLNGKTSKVVIR